jgi:2,3-bisphosphoglycerate-independent phosphoglycerate mutase
MGFDPAAHHTGRGPIEAAAQGLELDPDDLVWRLNLVRVAGPGPEDAMLDYSSGHITTEQSTPLVEDLQAHLGDGTFTFVPGIQYRHLLVQRGGAREPEAALDIRPPHDITASPGAGPGALRRLAPLAELRRGPQSSGAPANATRANAIWPWGQGRPLLLPAFAQAFGLRGAVVSAVDLVRGLGRASGMEVAEVPGVTGLLDTNYQGKVDAALDFLARGGDFVFLHVEAPDECGHSGIAADKVEAVRRFDERVVGPIVRALEARRGRPLDLRPLHTPGPAHPHPGPGALPAVAPAPADHGLPAFSEANAAATGLPWTTATTCCPTRLERLRG